MINTDSNRHLQVGGRSPYPASAKSKNEIDENSFIPIESYVIPSSPERIANYTESVIKQSIALQNKGHDVSLNLTPEGVQKGFTADQSKRLSEAGVKIKLPYETLKDLGAQSATQALKAAGLDVSYLPSPSEQSKLIHKKVLIVDDEASYNFSGNEIKGSTNFTPLSAKQSWSKDASNWGWGEADATATAKYRQEFNQIWEQSASNLNGPLTMFDK